MNYSIQKAINLFGSQLDKKQVLEAEKKGILPQFPRTKSGVIKKKSWDSERISLVGEQIGYLKSFGRPLAFSIFVTKGGVLKSSLTLNLARSFALHNIKTCVVGLDMQGDITSCLLPENQQSDEESLEDALARIEATQGLADFFEGRVNLEDITLATDLPCLSIIPETPELVALDQSIINKNRREYWLKDNVIKPLKEKFDIILIDCSPNWNRLITNALTASDYLISPLECKISNFRNLKVFRAFVQEFKKDMNLNFEQIFVGTRLSPNRKLSNEIKEFYADSLPHFLKTSIRESTQGEEAVAMSLSVPEYSPTSAAGQEIRTLTLELSSLIRRLEKNSEKRIEQESKTIDRGL